MNCWLSAKGISDDRFVFPYKGKTSSGEKIFSNREDVLNEVMIIADEVERYNKKENKNLRIGESIYYDSFYFANHSDLVDSESQIMIKTYLYSKESNTPPFKDINSTPASFIDDFMLVRDELNYIHNLEVKEKNVKNK